MNLGTLLVLTNAKIDGFRKFFTISVADNGKI